MQDSKLLERSFKLKFGLKLCLYTIIGMLVLTSFLHFVTSRSLGSSYNEAIYTIYDLKIKIFPLIFASFYSIFILTLVTLCIAAISIFFSHKIAGPLFRLEKNLESIGSGDLTVNTRFRGNDQLSVLADEINEMVRSLNHTVRSVGDALSSLERAEAKLAELINKADPQDAEVQKAIKTLGSAIEEFRRIVSAAKAKER